jgi:plasmid stabilization system protein ParE
MKFEIHEAAKAEIQNHYDWYAARDPRVADRLADLFEKVAFEVARNPRSYPLLEVRQNPGNLRRARLKGFPLFVLYQVNDDSIEVLAVPHTAQKPGYWRSRLQR